MLKINFDGVVFIEMNEAGIRVIARNENREVIVALSKKVALPSLVEILEMMATRRATQFFMELGYHQVVFEGDSKLTIQSLTVESSLSLSLSPPPPLGHLVKDFKPIATLLRTHSHIRRQGNFVAHVLVKRARLSFSFLVWMEDVEIIHFGVVNFPS